MGQKQNLSTKLVINYSLFQKKIEKYLTNWKNHKSENIIKKGYLIDPNWIKKWKQLLEYDEKIKLYLDEFKIESTNMTNIQQTLIDQFIEPITNAVDIKKINIDEDNYLLQFQEYYISLEVLQNLMDEDTYNILYNINNNELINIFIKNDNIKKQEVEYIFKQKILIIFFEEHKIIKLIYYYQEKNKIINLKFLFDDINNYYEFQNVLRKNSTKIVDFINSIDIPNLNKNQVNFIKFNNKFLSLLYEDEDENINITPNRDNKNEILHCNTMACGKNAVNNLLNNDYKETKGKKVDNDYIDKIKKAETLKEKDFNDLIEAKKLLSVNVITAKGNLRSYNCLYNMTFNKFKENIIKEFPEYKNANIYFTANGKKIDTSATFRENNIKDGDAIMLNECYN